METPKLLIDILQASLPTITFATILLIKYFCYKKRTKKTSTFNGIVTILSMFFMFVYFYVLNVHDSCNITLYVLLSVSYYIGVTNILTLDRKGGVFYTVRIEQFDEDGKKYYTILKEMHVPFSKFITGKAKSYVSGISGYDLLKGSIYKLNMGEYKK